MVSLTKEIFGEMPSVVGESALERGGTLELTLFIVFPLSPLIILGLPSKSCRL